jgi:glycosyltransferase involved in cell wall biosynthesis
MAEYATQILTDPELAHRFSVAAKKRAAEFSIEKIAHQYYDVYLPLVAQGAPCSESK